MSLRMLLEGPDLKGILREVETNYGRDFHVIQAEQVRSGGVGGFFTKQHYEVTIEIADPKVAADIAAQPQTAGMSLHELSTRSQNDQAAASSQEWARDLLERARALSAAESGTEDGSLGAVTNSATEEDPDASSWSNLTSRTRKPRKFRLGLRSKKAAKRAAGGSSRTAPASAEQQKRLQDLLNHGPLVEDQIEDQLASEVISATQIEAAFNDKDFDDDDDNFHDLPPAARLVAQMDGTPTLIRNNVKDSSPKAKDSGSKEVIAGVRINAAPKTEEIPVVAAAPATAPTLAPSHHILGPESEAYWRVQIADQIKAQRDKVEKFYARRGPIGTEEARRIQIFAMAETIARTLPTRSSVESLNISSQDNSPETLPNHVEQAPAAQTFSPAAQTFAPVVTAPKPKKPKPATFALKFQAPNFAPVTHAGANIPEGIPTSAGEVLVLIGDIHEAYQQASTIIDIADCGGIDVLVIAPAGLSVPGVDPEDHFRHSSADEVFDLARRSDSPTIVIVHAPFPIGNDDLERVRIVKAIEALETPHVWAIVDASHAISSLSRWTQCFGYISALAVVNAKEPKNPQTLKALGIPIVLMDGVPCLEDSAEITSPISSPAVEQIGSISV
jgi:hypothetical protein